MKQLSVFALALSMLGAVSVASAQEAPDGDEAPARPQMQPAEARGAITRLIVGPMGRVRGFQLADGAVVMAPPRATESLRVGQVVRVAGLARPGGDRVIVRPTVRSADGTVLLEAPAMGAGHGPFGGHGGGRWGRRGGGHGGGHDGDDGGAREGLRARMEAMQDVRARGVVQTVIAGRRGSPRTLLLSNNTTLLLPRAVGEQLAQHGVRVGDAVQASGRGGSYPQGTSLIVRELVLPDGARLTAPSAAEGTR